MRRGIIVLTALLCLITVAVNEQLTLSPASLAQEGLPEAQDAPELSEAIELSEALTCGRTGQYGRAAIYADAFLAAISDARAAGTEFKIEAGETFKGLAEESIHTWSPIQANDDGWMQGRELVGAWVAWRPEPSASGWYQLNAQGHSHVIVDGAWHIGDVYSRNRTRTPLWITPESLLVFQIGRGRLKATLQPATENVGGSIRILKQDPTLPDIVASETSKLGVGAIVISNASNIGQEIQLSVQVLSDGEAISDRYRSSAFVARGTTRKVPFSLPIELADVEPGKYALQVSFLEDSTPRAASIRLVEVGTQEFSIRVRERHDNRRVTFISEIDGSVQYYGLREALAGPDDPSPAIILSLHGASVEGIGQSRSYASKSWAHIVAPTNRRPFGFDWEDWGREDAMEVLEHAQSQLRHDPQRTYLTGHSMGGHGTWQVAAHFPDQFAAIGPSAGWVDFWSYGGGGRYKDLPATLPLKRSMSPHRTLELKSNYKDLGIYILHGDADDNVPVDQARSMKTMLKETGHSDWRYHEEPGKKHWWNFPGPGADCVDWRPMMEFFARRRIPERDLVTSVDFATSNPRISSSMHWAHVIQQEVPLKISRLQVTQDMATKNYVASTENIAAFRIDGGQRNLATINGSELLEVPEALVETEFWLYVKTDEEWTAYPNGQGHHGFGKIPERGSGFKHAFDNRFVLVYGTKGTDQENAWSYNKARYDAEHWWYRGNGSCEILSDVDVDPENTNWLELTGRNVILYGNADTNGAFAHFLEASPIQLNRNSVTFGKRTLEREDAAAVWCYPSPHNDTALVAVIGGTGVRGCELTTPLKYFTSGAAFPDFLIVDSGMLRKGSEGVVASGHFDNDWQLNEALMGVRSKKDRDER